MSGEARSSLVVRLDQGTDKARGGCGREMLHVSHAMRWGRGAGRFACRGRGAGRLACHVRTQVLLVALACNSLAVSFCVKRRRLAPVSDTRVALATTHSTPLLTRPTLKSQRAREEDITRCVALALAPLAFALLCELSLLHGTSRALLLMSLPHPPLLLFCLRGVVGVGTSIVMREVLCLVWLVCLVSRFLRIICCLCIVI